jgi:hypothetical protein
MAGPHLRLSEPPSLSEIHQSTRPSPRASRKPLMMILVLEVDMVDMKKRN